jgi:hypothetical protein
VQAGTTLKGATPMTTVLIVTIVLAILAIEIGVGIWIER